MPLLNRDLQITYGSFTIGGTTDRLIDGTTATKVEDDFVRASYEVTFTVKGVDNSSFATECANVEAAFRIPRQDMVVSQGAATLKSLKQSDSSGLDCDPKIVKAGHIADTGRSRRYTVRFDFGRPADNVGTSGRRSTTTQTEYTSARRRRVSVAGVYTAITTNTSLQQYLANIDAWALTQLNVVDSTATWELVEEPRSEFNSTNKVLEFTRVYQEIIYPEPGASSPSLDNPNIVNQEFVAKFTAIGAQDSPGTGFQWAQNTVNGTALNYGPLGNTSGAGAGATVTLDPTTQSNPITAVGTNPRPFGKINLNFRCWVNKTLTTDLVGLYTGTIRAWLLSEAPKVLQAGYTNPALMEETPAFDRTDNRIEVNMEFWAQGPVNIVSQHITTDDNVESYGYVVVPGWNGDPLGNFVYQGPKIVTRTITETRRVINLTSDVLGSAPTFQPGVIPKSRKTSKTPVVIGTLPGGGSINAWDVVITTTVQFYNPINQSGPVATPSSYSQSSGSRPPVATGSSSGPVSNSP